MIASLSKSGATPAVDSPPKRPRQILHHENYAHEYPPAGSSDTKTVTDDNTLPIIRSLRLLHKDLYCSSEKLLKRDKLGIHAQIEKQSLACLTLAIEAAFRPKSAKQSTLEELRLQVEILKHLIRTEHELGIVPEKTYLRLAEQLVEISKMTNGWLTYATQKEPHGSLM
ncbi:MAG: four helix bundle protein [bacterium]